MLEVERVLAHPLAECRSNRWRNPEVDVSMHLQYDSWIQAHRGQVRSRSDELHSSATSRLFNRLFGKRVVGKLQERRVDTIHFAASGTREYSWNIFSNDDAGRFYFNLERVMLQRPVFFGIDDDLRRPNASLIEYHRRELTAFFERHWPRVAPWELH